jgi:hypothetical protein
LARRPTLHRPSGPSGAAQCRACDTSHESGDVEALVALLTDDVLISMPPVPPEFQGRDGVARFFANICGEGRPAYDLVPAKRANGQLAFGAFLRTSADIRQGTSLLVLTLTGDRISPSRASTRKCCRCSGCRNRPLLIFSPRVRSTSWTARYSVGCNESTYESKD